MIEDLSDVIEHFRTDAGGVLRTAVHQGATVTRGVVTADSWSIVEVAVSSVIPIDTSQKDALPEGIVARAAIAVSTKVKVQGPELDSPNTGSRKGTVVEHDGQLWEVVSTVDHLATAGFHHAIAVLLDDRRTLEQYVA